VLVGMVLVALGGSLAGEFKARAMRAWTVAGCVGSAAAILLLAAGGLSGPGWPLRATVMLLGAANGAFAVSAIGAMMGLAHQGRESRAGVRMGLWGAAQAVAFGLGGLFGTGASDIARFALGAPALAYAAVFAVEAAIFLLAAWLAVGVFTSRAERPGIPASAAPGGTLASAG
jgi:BCD family chlorophyll transporter-like MFS transporter